MLQAAVAAPHVWPTVSDSATVHPTLPPASPHYWAKTGEQSATQVCWPSNRQITSAFSTWPRVCPSPQYGWSQWMIVWPVIVCHLLGVPQWGQLGGSGRL